MRHKHMSAAKHRRKISDFFRDEYAQLVNYTRRLIDWSSDRDAEDVVQDVLVSLIDLADLTRPVENLSAYIYRSVKNRITDIFRRKKDVVSLDETDGFQLKDVIQDAGIDVSKILERDQEINRLYKLIDGLDPKEKALIIANEFEGITYRQLGEELQEPIGTLLARKSRALKKIRKGFADLKKNQKRRII